MAAPEIPESSSWREKLARATPGLVALLPYDRKNLSYDVVTGLSVAAVALPVGVAYAQLAALTWL